MSFVEQRFLLITFVFLAALTGAVCVPCAILMGAVQNRRVTVTLGLQL